MTEYTACVPLDAQKNTIRGNGDPGAVVACRIELFRVWDVGERADEGGVLVGLQE